MHYLLDPGSQDITTQVMVDQLMKTSPGLSVTLQSDWLRRWGIDDLVSEGTQYWDKHKSSPDIAAIKMRSRANEGLAIKQQLGLGGFQVFELDR